MAANVEMQAAARVHALQARIRPHFLFNSMNTIASLTRTDPARAEQAVQDLADLFRANLSEKRNTITLEEELEVGAHISAHRAAASGLAAENQTGTSTPCRATRSSPD